MTRPVLDVRHLEVHADGRSIVADLSFAITAGKTLALIGESGSGKSVTAAAIMGLLTPGLSVSPRTRIMLSGEPLQLRDEKSMRRARGREMAMVFQDPMSCLNPFMTVGAQIEEALARLELPRGPGRRAHVAKLIETVEIRSPETIRQRYPHELSGGQQQRIMLAMALAAEPKLLVADEPTSALDASVQAEIIGLLRRLQDMSGMAMLFITHDLAVATRLAHDVMVLKAGRVVEQGPLADVLRAPSQEYTRTLIAARQMLEVPPSPAPATSDVVLSVAHLSFDYPARRLFQSNVRALDDVSLSLKAGQTLGVIGESGSGKSTLAAVVAGLVPGTSGDVSLFGTSLAEHRFVMPKTLRQRCQIVFQNPYGALNPRHTVETAMREPLDLLRLGPPTARRDRVVEQLEAVGLGVDLLKRFPHQLSGGQRQRVCVGRALLSQPDLLVCDEIVSALDASVQAQILELLKRLQAERGFAMLFIGHDLAVVRWVSDEIAVMHRGRVVDQGPVDRVLTAPQGDYAQQLVASVYGTRQLIPRAGPPEARGFTLRFAN